jgi:hypothetical protein
VYHYLKKIDCRPLERLNQLARITLSFGLERETHVPKRQARELFIQHCEAHDFKNAGSWLWRKNTISNPLFALAQIPIHAKNAILPAYDADTDLEAAFQRGEFAYFVVPSNNKPALEFVKRIMQSFYTNVLAIGVDADVLNEKENLTRQMVLRAFVTAQESNSMLVCPGCDGSPPEEEADGTIREDVDHFFPKSRYPFLTIHPLNLTPYCKHCNQDYKKAKDPLKVKNGTPTIALNDIFHPYIHSVRDNGKHMEVKVIVQRYRDNLPHVKILPLDSDPHHVSRHASLDHLLSLQTRWDGALKANHITKPMKLLLASLLTNEANQPFVPTMEWLLEKLPNIEKTIQDGIGEQERHIPALAYVQWTRNDVDEQSVWLEKLRLYMS